MQVTRERASPKDDEGERGEGIKWREGLIDPSWFKNVEETAL